MLSHHERFVTDLQCKFCTFIVTMSTMIHWIKPDRIELEIDTLLLICLPQRPNYLHIAKAHRKPSVNTHDMTVGSESLRNG